MRDTWPEDLIMRDTGPEDLSYRANTCDTLMMTIDQANMEWEPVQ
jgi:hypothetical protein